jgi:putative transposase
MTRTEVKPAISAVKELMAQEPDALQEIVRGVMQTTLEAEMDKALGAGKSERNDTRLGYRSGYYKP